MLRLILRIVLWVGGLAALLALLAPVFGLIVLPIALEVFSPVATQNFRLSIVIDDNGREVVGSTVYQVSAARFSRGLGVVKERAIADLGGKGLLFMAATDGWGSYAELHFALSFCIHSQISGNHDNTRYDAIKKITALPEGSFYDISTPFPERMRECLPSLYDGMEEIRKNSLPLLLRFRDFSDPTTVEAVDPLNMEATYGPGVKLVRIRLETTSAPVSRSMEPAPEWLRKGAWLPIGDASHPVSSSIITGLLLDEIKKEGVEERVINGHWSK
jgi:hypothetical protein